MWHLRMRIRIFLHWMFRVSKSSNFRTSIHNLPLPNPNLGIVAGKSIGLLEIDSTGKRCLGRASKPHTAVLVIDICLNYTTHTIHKSIKWATNGQRNLPWRLGACPHRQGIVRAPDRQRTESLCANGPTKSCRKSPRSASAPLPRSPYAAIRRIASTRACHCSQSLSIAPRNKLRK